MNSEQLQCIARGATTELETAELRGQLVIIAHRIANAASDLDGLNVTQAIQPRDILRSHAETLHDIAEQLACERAHEIYGDEVEA